MSNKSTGIIILICLFFLLPLNVFSSSIIEDYELQEKCGIRSEDWFKIKYGDGIVGVPNGVISYDYKNHYNKKLNKCFVLLTVNGSPSDENKGSSLSKELYDINENKLYGSIVEFSKIVSPISCNVLESKLPRPQGGAF